MSEYTQLNYESDDDTTNQKSSGKNQRKKKQANRLYKLISTHKSPEEALQKSKNSEATVN